MPRGRPKHSTGRLDIALLKRMWERGDEKPAIAKALTTPLRYVTADSIASLARRNGLKARRSYKTRGEGAPRAGHYNKKKAKTIPEILTMRCQVCDAHVPVYRDSFAPVEPHSCPQARIVQRTYLPYCAEPVPFREPQPTV